MDDLLDLLLRHVVRNVSKAGANVQEHGELARNVLPRSPTPAPPRAYRMSRLNATFTTHAV